MGKRKQWLKHEWLDEYRHICGHLETAGFPGKAFCYKTSIWNEYVDMQARFCREDGYPAMAHDISLCKVGE